MDIKYIDRKEVPEVKPKWDSIFESIPTDKALVLNDHEAKKGQQALYTRLRNNQFTYLTLTTQTVDGTTTLYVYHRNNGLSE